ncbi:MAG: peptidylprolyl isomerase [Anaerolineae bacterium]
MKKDTGRRGKRIWVLGMTLLALLTACATEVSPTGEATTSTPRPSPTSEASVPESETTTAPVEEMPERPADRDGMYSAPPEMQIDPEGHYAAEIETEHGTITVRLFAEQAPKTVNNFVFLAREGFYDGTTFHRVIPGFMAQGGDPTGSGTGGPGYTFEDEFDPRLSHDRVGILSMANSGPDTNGSQFFITFAPTTWLDDRHTVFGRVVDGLEALKALSPRDPEVATEPGDIIKTIRIVERETPLDSTLPAPGEVAPPQEPTARNAFYARPPEMQIDSGAKYEATITTAKGDIVVSLDAAAAPATVNNFVTLAQAGFYNGLTFHRVEPDFVIQGGDPAGNGQGGPGYVLPPEIGLKHVEGAIAMARLPDQGNPRRMSSGSQFYITLKPTPQLDGAYSVFGQVTRGMEVVRAIEVGDVIEKITIAVDR